MADPIDNSTVLFFASAVSRNVHGQLRTVVECRPEYFQGGSVEQADEKADTALRMVERLAVTLFEANLITPEQAVFVLNSSPLAPIHIDPEFKF